MRKHNRDCIGICIAAGLTVTGSENQRRHFRVNCEEGPLTFPSTPSDHRWRKNMRSEARRLAK